MQDLTTVEGVIAEIKIVKNKGVEYTVYNKHYGQLCIAYATELTALYSLLGVLVTTQTSKDLPWVITPLD